MKVIDAAYQGLEPPRSRRASRRKLPGSPQPRSPLKPYSKRLSRFSLRQVNTHFDLTRLSGKHRPNGRRPPLPTSLRCRYAVGIQPARDLTETSLVGVLPADAGDHLAGKTRPATASRGRSRRCSRPSPPLGEEALDLVDRDKARPPAGLDRLDEGQDTADERRATDPEGCRRLGSRVREPLDVVGFADDDSGSVRPPRRGFRMPPCLLGLSTTMSAARHAYNVHQYGDRFASRCICVSHVTGVSRIRSRSAARRRVEVLRTS